MENNPMEQAAPTPEDKEDLGAIELTDDPELFGKLKQKFDEYEGRMDPYLAPEMQADTIYKFEIMKALLEKKSVQFSEIRSEMKERFGHGFQPGPFNNAWWVIREYSLDRTDRLRGGTGLGKSDE